MPEACVGTTKKRIAAPVSSGFWTFYGPLSNVEYTVTVTEL